MTQAGAKQEARLLSALLARVTCSCPDHRVVLVRLRALAEQLEPPRRPAPAAQPMQLSLLPSLQPNELVPGCPLNCGIAAKTCIRRQIESDKDLYIDPNSTHDQRRHAKKRGRVSTFALCVTERCAVGRSVRATLGDAVAEDVRHGDRRDIAAQRSAEAVQRNTQVEIPTLEEFEMRGYR